MLSYQNYRQMWDNADNLTPAAPLNLDLEISSVCNLRCPFCYHSSPDWKAKKQFMPLDFAKRVIDEAFCIGIPALKPNWRGEPTLHPDFTEIIRYARPRFTDIIINTNGNWPDAAFNGLLLADGVIISVDSFEHYGRSRVGGDFAALIGNIRKLLAFKTDSLTVELRKVETEKNAAETFEQQCIEMFGAQCVPSVHKVFDRCKLEKVSTPRKYCGQPSRRIIVSSDGFIYPCCVDFNEEYCLGHFDGMPLLKAWDSGKMIRLRENLKCGKYHGFCNNCTSYSSYKTEGK